MTNLYQDIQSTTQDSLRKRYISIIIVGVVALCVVIICSCLVDYYNKKIIVAINVIITSLAGCFIYGTFTLPIALLRNYMRVCQKINNGNQVQVSGTLKEFSKDTITIDRLSYYCITLQVKDSTQLYMIDSSFTLPQFNNGEYVTLLAVDRLVVGLLRGAQNAEK